MNDIDPTKMTEAERMALFASFTKDITPAAPARKTLAVQLAPWRSAIRADRARGLDWKQLAEVCATHLNIKTSPKSLQIIIGGPARRTTKRTKKVRTAGTAVGVSTSKP